MLLTNEYYQNVKDYLHPNIRTFVSYYRDGNIIRFPNYHVCNYKNKNGNRKIIKYELGEQCINPTDKPYWKKTKDKYKHGHLNNKRQYWTRHLTWTRQRCLFKNKGNSVYNYKLKKFEHMAETPMCFELNYLQDAKEKHLKECP